MATMGEFWDQRWKDGQDVHPKHRNALKLFNESDRSATVGDFGCGPGVFLNLLKTSGFDPAKLWGVDVSAEAVDACQRAGFNGFHGEFSNFPHRVDIAVLIDVVEHVFDPDSFFEWLRATAEEMVIAVPNFSSYRQRLEMLSGRVPFQNKVNRGGHVFFTNRPVLLGYFRRHGLRVIGESHVYTGESKGVAGAMAAKVQGMRPNLFALGLGFRLKKA